MNPPSTMMIEEERESARVLFLPQNPHDAHTAEEIFEEEEIDLVCCSSLSKVVAELGRGVGAVVVAEEQLRDGALDRLIELIEAQPTWSDLPLLVITRSGRPYPVSKRLGEVGNVTLIERPIHFRPLVSMVRSALRDRRRQYAIRRSLVNRDRFLAMLGHELRNPLAAIIFGVEQLDSDVPESAREVIRRQSSNLERIVDDLLDVSRISCGALSFEKERINLAEVVAETSSAFENIARDSDVTLELQISGDASLWVHGDAVRLEQMLGNLLKNAMRYTPAGGRVLVSAEQEGCEAVVRVVDTGIGIPKEMLENIFELFSQAHVELSRREGGLGLGLSLAHRIVESHDGTITADSNGEGEGSKFEVRLPMGNVEAPEQQAVTSDEAAGIDPDKLHLLVVEDVDDLRGTFCEMLRLRGYEVDEAATGQQGIDTVDADVHDVVLLDIGLPDRDGFEVAQAMRVDGFDGLLVALTGYSGAEDRERAERAGFDCLLTKPVSFKRLEAVLESQLA